jgi:SAM-dependent methyltransferase
MTAQTQSSFDSDPARALARAVQAVRDSDSGENRVQFVRTVLRGYVSGDADFRGVLTRALNEAWAAPRLLFNPALVLIKNGPSRPFIERAVWAWPKPLSEGELASAGAHAVLYKDDLLIAVLQSTIAADLELEKFLTAMRRIVLEQAMKLDASRTPSADVLAFASALARQSFINEYIFRTEKDEKALLDKLLRLLKQKQDAALAPLWVAVAASYMPLGEIPQKQIDFSRVWPAPVQAVVEQQIHEPEAIRAHGASIPRITGIEDGVSLAVQHQYEENPYPRWVSVPRRPGAELREELKSKFPQADIRGGDSAATLNVLIAGCGTGQQVPEYSSYPRAKTLAVDLSRASLAYAKYKADGLGLRDVEFAQADILKLGLPPASYDLVVSTGVLHHLEDPEAGWRRLISLLKPDGFMLIGLYSEAARRHIVAARDYIAANKYRSTDNAIRKFRQDLISEITDPGLRTILKAPDFYSLSECRDLLFHVQEHRFTIPRIAQFIAENGLVFLGFENTVQPGKDFARHFSQPEHLADLNRWHQYEQNNPGTFESMYNFWLQKRESD